MDKLCLNFALSGGREGEKPPCQLRKGVAGESYRKILPVASVGRSIASLLLTIDTAPTDRQGVTPRRYIAVGVPPRYFDLASSHAPALGCWDGSGTCRRIISGVLRVPSFPIFCSSGSGLIFRMRPRLPRLPRAGRMTQPQSFGIAPACESRRRHPRQEHTRGNHARARSVRRIYPCGIFPRMLSRTIKA